MGCASAQGEGKWFGNVH